MKTLKFDPDLVEKILSGEKVSTWRLFDDKDLQVGDELTLINKETDETFGTGKITTLSIRTLGTLTDEDWNGHERFASDEEMYATFRTYYGDKVDANSEVKILTFDFIPKTKPVLGLDIGGVILDFVPHRDTDLAFAGDRYLETPAIEGAFDAIAELNSGKFAGSVYLVSRHGPDGPARILEWLHKHDFFKKTGLTEKHYFPCLERHEKAAIVQKLGVTHFVDDRAEVLGHMVGTVPHLYLFQSLDESRENFADLLPKMRFVQTWEELLPALQ